jgi:AraC family transcriptional regulator, transcriptional activator of pobA
MDTVKIHKIDSNTSAGFSFKICGVSFDKACVIQDEIQSELFNILWVKEGRGRYKIDFESYDIEDDTIFFLTPGQVLEIEDESIRSGYRMAFSQDFYCIESQGKDIACNGVLFNNIYELPYIKISESDKATFEQMISQFFDELENPGDSHDDMIATYLKLFLIQATRLKKQQPIKNEETHPKQALSDQFSELVEKNFRTKHAVSDYADLLNMAPKTLTKKMQLERASAPSEFIQNRLVLEAKRLLTYGDQSVKEIAYDLGFEDPAYFTRFFTKKATLSPNQFRAQVV